MSSYRTAYRELLFTFAADVLVSLFCGASLERDVAATDTQARPGGGGTFISCKFLFDLAGLVQSRCE